MAEILFDDEDDDLFWMEDPYDKAVSTASPARTVIVTVTLILESIG